jgi:hypothetical protein
LSAICQLNSIGSSGIKKHFVADQISGGNGNDILTGGPGKDHFVVQALTQALTQLLTFSQALIQRQQIASTHDISQIEFPSPIHPQLYVIFGAPHDRHALDLSSYRNVVLCIKSAI